MSQHFRVDILDILMYIACGLIVVAVFILATLPFTLYRNMRETERLMAACLLDRPEYECASLLKRSSSSVMPMPVVVR